MPKPQQPPKSKARQECLSAPLPVGLVRPPAVKPVPVKPPPLVPSADAFGPTPAGSNPVGKAMAKPAPVKPPPPLRAIPMDMGDDESTAAATEMQSMDDVETVDWGDGDEGAPEKRPLGAYLDTSRDARAEHMRFASLTLGRRSFCPPGRQGRGRLAQRPSLHMLGQTEVINQKAPFFVTLRMVCQECEKMCNASEYLLRSLETWCGNYDGVCKDCGRMENESEKNVRKRIRQQWRARGVLMGKKYTRAREYVWQDVERDLLQQYPEASKAALREVIRMQLRSIATAWAADLSKNPRHKAFAEAVHRQYAEALGRCVGAPVLTMAGGGWSLSAEDCQHLTALSDSILIMWVCRSPGCLSFQENSCWIRQRGGSKYRCPNCEDVYRPWSCEGGRIGVQKCVAINWGPHKGWQIIPCTWPSSEEDTWLHQQMEAYSRATVLDEDIDDFLAKKRVQLSQLLRPFDFSTGHGGRFQQVQFRTPCRIYPEQWDWSHLEGRSYWTGRLAQQELDTNVFSSWEFLIPLLGSIISAGNAILSRM